MTGDEKLLEKIKQYEKLVSLCENRIAKIEFLLSMPQSEDILAELNQQHDAVIEEWYKNYMKLMRLNSLLE